MSVSVRLLLATLNAFSIALLRRAVSTRFGRPTSMWYALLAISQFHIPFWMGRTLPNMFALFPGMCTKTLARQTNRLIKSICQVNLASLLLLYRAPTSNKPSLANFNRVISLLVFTCTVFRSEVLLLLTPIAAQGLALGGRVCGTL